MRDDQRWALSSLAFSIAFSDLACFVSLSFAGLVVLARSLNPIPSRTRPLNSSAPMVLWLKPWESRSLPGLPKTKQFLFTCHDQSKTPPPFGEAAFFVTTRQAREERSLNSERGVIIRPRFGISFRRKFTSHSFGFP